MLTHHRRAVRRALILVTTLGLVSTFVISPAATAKAKKKTTKKAAATTVKKNTAAKPAGSITGGGGSKNSGTIKLGTYASGINAATGAAIPEETKKISQVWETMTNAAGGINGYKVEVLYRDARGDNARTLAAVKDLDSKGVVAIAGQGEAARLPAIVDYVNQKKIPVIGGQPYNLVNCSDPMLFPVPTCQAASTYGAATAAAAVGTKNFRDLFCIEVAACAAAVPIRTRAVQREGMKFSSESASAVAADYTAPCLSAKNAGIDFIQSTGLNFANLIRDCQRQNYHPTYAQGGAAAQSTIDAAKGENVAGNLTEAGAFYTGPEMARFRQAVAQTDLKYSEATLSQTAVQSWLGLEMAGAIIKKLSGPNPSRADFLAATYTIKGETLNGQVPPMDFTVQRPGTGLHANSDCWTQHVLKDGVFFHADRNGQVVSRLTWICGTGLKYVIGSDPTPA